MGAVDRRRHRVIDGISRLGAATAAADAARARRGALAERARRLLRGLPGLLCRHAALGMDAGALMADAEGPAGHCERVSDRIFLSCFAGFDRARVDRLASLDASVSDPADQVCARVARGIPDRRARRLERAGEPYRPWLSVGQIVAWRLQQAIPGRQFPCEILAWLGDSLETQHHKLAALERRPDAVIIYSGHNEFAARFEEEREGWLDEEPGNRLLGAAFRASLSSPFCRLVYESDQQEPPGSSAATLRPSSARGPPALQPE